MTSETFAVEGGAPLVCLVVSPLPFAPAPGSGESSAIGVVSAIVPQEELWKG